jgi:dTDP-4-amino-4,6-dideoxygalactose transaminase
MIPCSSPLAQFQSHASEINKAIADVLASGNYILGEKVIALEGRIAAYCGSSYAIGVNSGTDALILSLRALGVGAGDEVITVAHTAIATLSAIIAVGAIPVLIDIDPQFWTIDPDLIESSITAKTKVIIAVHIYGQSVDLQMVSIIAKRHSLYLIEDCAQSIGTKNDGRVVGSIGDLGCFSFYPTKNLGAIGDGGMVVTNNKFLAEKIRRLRQYGWNQVRQVEGVGLNSRLDEIQAAILLVKLKYLDKDNSRRNDIARQYLEGIRNPRFILPKIRPNTTHSFHLFPVLCETRDDAINFMRKNMVNIGVHYYPACHMAKGYREKVRLGVSGLKMTEHLSQRVMSVPMYPELSMQDVAKVIDTMNSY